MLEGLIHAHSGFRWIVLIILISAVFMSLFKWNAKAPFGEGDRKLYFFAMLSVHIQLLLGLALFFISEKVQFVSGMMSQKILRFFTVEHSLLMIIAIILISLGYAKSKKAESDVQKHRLAFLYFVIGLILILVSIPWPFRGFGSGWI